MKGHALHHALTRVSEKVVARPLTSGQHAQWAFPVRRHDSNLPWLQWLPHWLRRWLPSEPVQSASNTKPDFLPHIWDCQLSVNTAWHLWLHSRCIERVGLCGCAFVSPRCLFSPLFSLFVSRFLSLPLPLLSHYPALNTYLVFVYLFLSCVSLSLSSPYVVPPTCTYIRPVSFW